MSTVSRLLATDELTVLLGLIAASTFLLRNLYKPQPLVHPILLGRQSDASRVRNPKESATYRNYGTGMMGRFPLRPSKEIEVLNDFVRPEHDSSRTLWSTKITNTEIRRRVSALRTGLVRDAGLHHESNVLLLLNDGIEYLLTDLALASHNIPSFTLSSLSLLSPVLESHPPSAIVTHAVFVPQLLELIHDSAEHGHHTIIYLGTLTTNVKSNNVKLINWDALERDGAEGEQTPEGPRDPNATFTVSFFTGADRKLKCAHITHQNMTAGVAAARTLLPVTNQFTPLDTIVSAHSLSTAYGRAVAYTAIYEGTSFATTDSTKLIHATESTPPAFLTLQDLTSTFDKYPIPSPTLLFVKPQHLEQLAGAINNQAGASSLWSLARRHKRSALASGFVSKDGLWDRLVLDTARAEVMRTGAGTVRGIIIGGAPLSAESLVPARIALSVPLVHVHAHPAVAGPVTASHALDVQVFPVGSGEFKDVAHAGPPAINVEAKLVGVDDDSVEKGEDPAGELLVRGPSVARVEVVGEEQDVSASSLAADGEQEWLKTEERARVMTNGCFQIVEARSK